MKFIRLNTKSIGLVPSTPIAINAERVAAVAANKDGFAIISFSFLEGDYIVVQESLEQVMALIAP